MDKVYLRSLFLREKGFLKNLYRSEDTAKYINNANDKSLDVLIRILHLIADGEIPIRRQDQSAIRNAKKFPQLHRLQAKKFFLSILNGDREKKVKIVKDFIPVYPHLLYTFFNEVSVT
jgi:hypothetical protein